MSENTVPEEHPEVLPTEVLPDAVESTLDEATPEPSQTEQGAEPQSEVEVASEPEPEAAPEPEPEAAPEPEPEVASEPEPATTPTPAPAAPRPAGVIPSPAALASRMAARPTPPVTAAPPAPAHSESARFGRVDEAGHVYVTVGEEEREVGSYPGASPEDALQYFARKYDELAATAALLRTRVDIPDVHAKEVADSLALFKEQVAEAKVVGDLAALDTSLAEIEEAVATKRAEEATARAAAKEAAAAAREAIVAEAEKIAATPLSSMQWKTSGERMRELLEEWKTAQRSGARLDKPVETALWERFSHARNGFDKARRSWFADLEQTRDSAKRAKERLVAEAEALSGSKDWAATARAFKGLMDQWRQAGRAARKDDDSLWERFRAAQDAFFSAKDEVVAAENEEYKANLTVKEALLVEAEALLPVTDLDRAKSALRTIQDKWDRAGKVPLADMDRIEKAIRRVESAVRDADEARWKSSNPEVTARATSMITQLEAGIAKVDAQIAAAEAAGESAKVARLREERASKEQFLAQVRSLG